MAYTKRKKTYTSEEKAQFAAERQRKVANASNAIIGQFQSGDLPAKLATVFLNLKDEKPCRTWSFSNQLLMILGGSKDARAYNSWKTVGRQVRKGEKAMVHILEPNRITIHEEDSETARRQFDHGSRVSRSDHDSMYHKPIFPHAT